MSDCCASSSTADERLISTSATLTSFAIRPGVTFPDWSVVTSSVVKAALLAMVGSDHVLSRWSGYSPDVDRVRVAILRLYAEHGGAPALATLAMRAGLNETAIWLLIEELRQRDLVVLDGNKIVGAYPFTDRDTGHRVTLNGRTLNAMRAVDALGVGAMTDRDIAIASRCGHCGAPVRITTQDRGRALDDVAPTTAAAWLSVRDEGGCAASSLCTTTSFFCSDDHLDAWREERQSGEPAFRLSIEEALEAGRAIFGPSLAGVESSAGYGNDAAETRGERQSSGDKASQDRPATHRRLGTNGRNNGSYDLAVIGAGSAGFSAAITAADQGAQVALIGSGTIGGTCVNIGCVPSKTLIRAAETLHNARAAARFAGIMADAQLSDWRGTVRQKDALVSDLRQAKYVDLLPAYNGIAYREGPARLIDGGVEVDGTRVPASKIIIATGARPAVPAITGIDMVPYLTSTTALELEVLPKSLLVIGGGYIGAELAQMFARAGVQVTLACRSRLLPEAEPAISAALTGYFADEGLTVVSGVAYRAIRQTETGIALTVERDGQDVTLNADRVLLASGRTPNTEGLGLAVHGIAVSAQGGIIVDDRMRTTKAGIYAVGDVTGRDQFVYMAAYGAKLAAKNALNSDSLRYDNSAMPAIVFTDPQVASARGSRYARACQACRRRRQRPATRRACPCARRGRQHPDRDAGDPAGPHRRRSRRHHLSVSHHRRRPEARGSCLREGRCEALMLRRLDQRFGGPNGHGCVWPLNALDGPGFAVRESAYCASAKIPTEPNRWAGLCLTLEGSYQVELGRTRLTCGPASLIFFPPGQAYGAHISHDGSHCLTAAIDPEMPSASDTFVDFERLSLARRAPPHWLAFQLLREIEIADDLSPTSVAHTLIALLTELTERPGLEARSTPPPWLARIQEQIHDEFRQHHTLESLAREAGVHHVHLARDFRRRFGCTVGHYIRQRRVEFGCHRLTASQDPLAEIAFDAGFADQSHFTNTFRRLVGMSPGTFRARFFTPPRRLVA